MADVDVHDRLSRLERGSCVDGGGAGGEQQGGAGVIGWGSDAFAAQ